MFTYQSVSEAFLGHVARLMKEQHVSIMGICRVTGMSDSHVSSILHRRVAVTLLTVERFAKVFGKEPWEMIK